MTVAYLAKSFDETCESADQLHLMVNQSSLGASTCSVHSSAVAGRQISYFYKRLVYLLAAVSFFRASIVQASDWFQPMTVAYRSPSGHQQPRAYFQSNYSVPNEPQVAGEPNDSMRRYRERRNFGLRLPATNLLLNNNNNPTRINHQRLDYETTLLNRPTRHNSSNAHRYRQTRPMTPVEGMWMPAMPATSKPAKLSLMVANVSNSIEVQVPNATGPELRQFIIEPPTGRPASAYNRSMPLVDSAQESFSIGIVINPDGTSGKVGALMKLGSPGGLIVDKKEDVRPGENDWEASNIEHVIAAKKSADSSGSESLEDKGSREKSQTGEQLKDQEESSHWKKHKEGEEQRTGEGKKDAKEGDKWLKDVGHNRHGWKNVYHKEEYAQHQKYHDVFRDKDWNNKKAKQNEQYQYNLGNKFNEVKSKDTSDRDKHGSKYDYSKGSMWRRHEDDNYANDDSHDGDATKEQQAASMEPSQRNHQYLPGNSPWAPTGSTYLRQQHRLEQQHNEEPDNDDAMIEQIKSRLERLSGHPTTSNSIASATSRREEAVSPERAQQAEDPEESSQDDYESDAWTSTADEEQPSERLTRPLKGPQSSSSINDILKKTRQKSNLKSNGDNSNEVNESLSEDSDRRQQQDRRSQADNGSRLDQQSRRKSNQQPSNATMRSQGASKQSDGWSLSDGGGHEVNYADQTRTSRAESAGVTKKQQAASNLSLQRNKEAGDESAARQSASKRNQTNIKENELRTKIQSLNPPIKPIHFPKDLQSRGVNEHLVVNRSLARPLAHLPPGGDDLSVETSLANALGDMDDLEQQQLGLANGYGRSHNPGYMLMFGGEHEHSNQDAIRKQRINNNGEPNVIFETSASNLERARLPYVDCEPSRLEQPTDISHLLENDDDHFERQTKNELVTSGSNELTSPQIDYYTSSGFRQPGEFEDSPISMPTHVSSSTANSHSNLLRLTPASSYQQSLINSGSTFGGGLVAPTMQLALNRLMRVLKLNQAKQQQQDHQNYRRINQPYNLRHLLISEHYKPQPISIQAASWQQPIVTSATFTPIVDLSAADIRMPKQNPFHSDLMVASSTNFDTIYRPILSQTNNSRLPTMKRQPKLLYIAPDTSGKTLQMPDQHKANKLKDTDQSIKFTQVKREKKRPIKGQGFLNNYSLSAPSQSKIGVNAAMTNQFADWNPKSTPIMQLNAIQSSSETKPSPAATNKWTYTTTGRKVQNQSELSPPRMSIARSKQAAEATWVFGKRIFDSFKSRRTASQGVK